jgi:hypothetical protein
MQDYQQNRKTAGSTAFGQPAFSGTTQPTTGTSLFGQSTQSQPANSMFGSFGNAGANNTTSGGAFGGGPGQTSTQPTGGFGTFNQAQAQAQQPAQQSATGFGAFNQAQQPQNAGLFGGNSAFATQNKPLGGFGMSYHQCLIVDLPYYRQHQRLWNWFKHRIYWSFWTDQYRATATCSYQSVWAKPASW